MKTLHNNYRTLMTMLMVSGMLLLNTDAFGQSCDGCGGTATGTNAVSVGGDVTGDESGVFGANADVWGEESIAIGTADVGTNSVDADGSFAIGIKAFAYGDNSFAIGHKVETDANDTYSYVFGRGLINTNLVNSFSNSIMFGMNSDIPTMFIEGAAGTSSSIGRVGIGTTAPDRLLHLKDESGDDTYMLIEKQGTTEGGILWHNGAQSAGTINAGIILNDAEDLYFENRINDEDLVFRAKNGTSLTEVMRIKGTNSRVGIGVISPSQKLHVRKEAATSTAETIAQFDVSDAGSGEYLRIGNGVSGDGVICPMVLGRNDNTTAPPLLLYGEIADNGTTTIPAMRFEVNYSGSTVDNRPSFEWRNAGTARMTMIADGNLGIGTASPGYLLEVNGTAGKPFGGTWTATSDINLKDEVEEFTDGLDLLLQFQPKWFSYNGTFGLPDEGRGVGVIAQDVRQIVPYMIDTVARVDTLLGVTQDFLTYDGTALTYIIVNSIKELEQRITNQDSLVQLVTNLGDQVNYLEQIVNDCCQSPQARYGSENEYGAVRPNNKLGEYVVLKTDPNPFSEYVKIAFVIPEAASNVEILISDTKGRLINRFNIDQRGAGEITFYGSEVRSGAYTCSLIIDGRIVKTNKMIKN